MWAQSNTLCRSGEGVGLFQLMHYSEAHAINMVIGDWRDRVKAGQMNGGVARL
jgi:hypothetical protein